jgi:hypothetical protein
MQIESAIHVNCPLASAVPAVEAWRTPSDLSVAVINSSSMPSGVVSPSKLHVPQMQIGSHGGPRMTRSDWVRRCSGPQ